MNQIDIERLQKTQLSLLKKIDSICDANGLVYYIIGGTLLGAVRHGGFIPWDPDIDIAMPRDDYEKLILFFEMHDSELFCQSIRTDSNHGSPHIIIKQKGTHIIYKKARTKYKAQNDGVYIDVFPLDKAPMDDELREKHAKTLLLLKRLLFSKVGTIYSESSIITKIEKRIMHILVSPFSFRLLQERLDKEMKKYDSEESEYLVSMASHYSYKKQLMKKEIYGTPQRLRFENEYFLAPQKPNEYLIQLYGDYMKLPPKEKRYQSLDSIKEVIYEDNVYV